MSRSLAASAAWNWSLSKAKRELSGRGSSFRMRNEFVDIFGLFPNSGVEQGLAVLGWEIRTGIKAGSSRANASGEVGCVSGGKRDVIDFRLPLQIREWDISCESTTLVQHLVAVAIE